MCYFAVRRFVNWKNSPVIAAKVERRKETDTFQVPLKII